MLLFYDDQHIEALGEIRWEFDMSQEVMAPRYLEMADIDNDRYIKDVLSSTGQNPELDDESSHLVELPESGTGTLSTLKVRPGIHYPDLLCWLRCSRMRVF